MRSVEYIVIRNGEEYNAPWDTLEQARSFIRTDIRVCGTSPDDYCIKEYTKKDGKVYTT